MRSQLTLLLSSLSPVTVPLWVKPHVAGRRLGDREQPAPHRAPPGVVVAGLLAELDEGLLHSSASPWSRSTWTPNLNSSMWYLR